MIEDAKLARSLHIYRVHFSRFEGDGPMNFTEIAIISVAFGVSLGYLIGIIQHVADVGGLINMEWI
jgi:hypothetical protein